MAKDRFGYEQSMNQRLGRLGSEIAIDEDIRELMKDYGAAEVRHKEESQNFLEMVEQTGGRSTPEMLDAMERLADASEALGVIGADLAAAMWESI